MINITTAIRRSSSIVKDKILNGFSVKDVSGTVIYFERCNIHLWSECVKACLSYSDVITFFLFLFIFWVAAIVLKCKISLYLFWVYEVRCFSYGCHITRIQEYKPKYIKLICIWNIKSSNFMPPTLKSIRLHYPFH